ncbi:MAG: hypothetical protein C0505_15320 [Leptothrix sp. (in: Bacteria)]|nr:hypothetical protein [Leptothrix sp. (in: b-proteobacteria)]
MIKQATQLGRCGCARAACRLRSGEKLFVELLADADDTLPTAVPRLRVAQLDRQAGALCEVLVLAHRSGNLPDDDARVAFQRSVPEYGPRRRLR